MSTKDMNNALEIARKEFEKHASSFESTLSRLEREAIMPAAVQLSSMEAQLAFNVKVVEKFADATKKYCATCDAIVLSLDATCQPMLSGRVTAQAVGDVARFMQEVKKSVDDIDIDFTASFDGSSVGSIGAFQPMLSLAAQTAVMFWNNHYQSMSGYKKDQERLQAEAKAERERKNERSRQNRNEVESRREKIAKMKEEAAVIAAKRDEVCRQCDSNIQAYHNALMAAQSGCKNRLLAAETHRLQEEMATAQEHLSRLKFFDFDEKKAVKTIIKNCQKSLANVTLPAATLAKLDEIVTTAEDRYKREVETYLKGRFALKQSCWDVNFFGETAMDAEVLEAIYNALSYTPQTAQEIGEKCGLSGSFVQIYLKMIIKRRDYLLCTEGKKKWSDFEYAFNPEWVKKIDLWKDKKPNSEVPPPPQDAEELFRAF